MVEKQNIAIWLVNKDQELDAIKTFDRLLFPKEEPFDTDFWMDSKTRAYWITSGKEKVGMTVLSVDATVAKRYDDEVIPAPGTLYIVSTGIAEKYRRRGIGYLVKKWQIFEAKRLNQNRIITNCRVTNLPIQELNKKAGFKPSRIIPNFFSHPIEDAVIMEREV